MVGVRSAIHVDVFRLLFAIVNPIKERREFTVTLPRFQLPVKTIAVCRKVFPLTPADPELQNTRVSESLAPVTGSMVTWMTVTAMLSRAKAVLTDNPNELPPKKLAFTNPPWKELGEPWIA